MAVKVKLYGNLRSKASGTDRTGEVGIVEVDGGRVRTIAAILEVLGLKEEEVSHLFLNNDYSALNRAVKDGDVVAIFPKNMVLLYKWYFHKNE